MTRIEQHVLYVAFYLYRSLAAAKSGEKLGGSGFWVGIESKEIPGFRWIYGVSNRHAVHKDGASVIRANSQDGRVVFLEKEPTDWIEHPNGHDVAILPINSKEVPGLSHRFVPSQMFTTQDQIVNGTIGIGDEAFMIGRFINHEGKARNAPSVRFGNISMLPGEPIFIDDSTPPQESFAVEMRSMCGYSGSPVFVETGGVKRLPNGTTSVTKSVDYLLGVHWGHIVEPWTVVKRIRERAAKTGLRSNEEEIEQVSANTGMNGVVPAWFLLELLNMPQLKKLRDQEEAGELERRARATPGAALDSAKEEAASEANPQHREDFNSLVNAAARKREPKD